jgi:ABC-type sugar transport system ATPase subunit
MSVAGAGDAIRLSTNGLDLSLPPARFPGLARNGASSVTVGVRPQHLRLGRPESQDQVGLSGALMVTEQLGDEQLLAIRIGEGDIRVAGVDPELTLATGTMVEVSTNMDNLHIFDGTSGAALR